MRHRKGNKKLNRSTAHRKALRRNLAISLLEHGSVRTTPQKAKFVQPFVERLITLAKKVIRHQNAEDPRDRARALHYRRRIISMLYQVKVPDPQREGKWKSVVQKLVDDIAPRYQNRPGGYTRVLRLPKRRLGDGAELCLFQLVEGEEVEVAPQVVETEEEKQQESAIAKEEEQKVEETTDSTKEETSEESTAMETQEEKSAEGEKETKKNE